MENISWDIIPIYIGFVIIGLAIFYHIIKAAIKNAMKEINKEQE